MLNSRGEGRYFRIVR